MTKVQREKLRMLFGGKCAYCGCELPEKGWHADHLEPIVRKMTQDMEAAKKGQFKYKATGECYHPERDNEDNLVPACKSCNIYKSSYDIEGAIAEKLEYNKHRADHKRENRTKEGGKQF
ncbi:HNH endonuclease [Providencia rettgeri]